jgi:hypothetical protein
MSIVDPDQKDWRLQAALALDDPKPSLGSLLQRLRGGPAVIGEIESSVSPDVVITHDGKLLFAYAASAPALARARAAIESALREDGVGASIHISHWDDELDDWRQIDPPLSESEQRDRERSDRAAAATETRTLVASVGREIRGDFERSLQISAAELGVECELVEHPHLLTTQVAFTVTGPHRKVAQFAAGLQAEERATIRIGRDVMASPL